MAHDASSTLSPPKQPRPPGPGGIPFLGVLPGLLRNPLKLYEDLARYGDVVEYRVGRTRAFMINRPEHIGEVFQRDNITFTRSVYHERIRSLFGDGLITSEGDSWRQQRGLMQPAFQKNRMSAYVPLVREATSDLLRDWRRAARTGERVNATADLARLTQTLTVQIMFGTDLAERSMGAIRGALATINAELYKQVLFGWWQHLPLPGNLRYRRATGTLEHIMRNVVQDKAVREGESHDLLTMLMQAHTQNTGAPSADRSIRDQMITIFIAGHDTTVSVLSWTLFLIGQHSAVMERIEREVDTVLGDGEPAYEHLSRLIYTKQVIEEAMRLYPPAYGLTRKAVTNTTLGGYFIPAGSLLFISPYVMHRHPNYWDEPLRFDPDRFTKERCDKRLRYTYFPFGGGPRTCIGIHLAMLEMVLVLAMTARAYSFSLAAECPVLPRPLLLLRPKEGVVVRLSPRHGCPPGDR
jgi:cytochrome P450